jgi:hypothetical protein
MMDTNAREWFEVHYLDIVIGQMRVMDRHFWTYQEAVNWADGHVEPGRKFFVYHVKRQFHSDYTATKSARL